jgi:hypothetical protein
VAGSKRKKQYLLGESLRPNLVNLSGPHGLTEKPTESFK